MKILESATKKSYPVVALRDGIIFPTTESVLVFGREKSVNAINAALKNDNKIVLSMQKNPNFDNPSGSDLFEIGVLSQIERIFEGEKGEISALIKGQHRVRIVRYLSESPYLEAETQHLLEIIQETEEVSALVRHINRQLREAINLGKGIDVVFLMNLMNNSFPSQFSEQISMILDVKTATRQELIEELNLLQRLKKQSELISKEVKVLEIERNIYTKTQKKFEKGMKDAVLREKLKTIERELGSESGEDREIADLEKKVKQAGMPEEVEKKVMKELHRFAQMNPYNPEASYLRTYFDLIVELPWNVRSDSNYDTTKAQEVLDTDHYGLNKVKERIIEYLSVLKLKQKNGKSGSKHPTILCFVGPPGVGKTSLGRSIARALGRKFVKISLGGIRDEAEIRGHRRTYVGALPGRIIQGIRQAETKNPVFMLDEIDKVGHDYRGDPSSALLEALDPEQNQDFSDHYLEVPFDLSDVMFITTANILDTIPSALRDRLEIINFPGYTEDEKFQIAKNYLVAKQKDVHGLADRRISISDEGLKMIIRRYSREAGVRELERQIATVFRKIARELVEEKIKTKKVTPADLHKYLGPYKYSAQMIEDKDSVGIVNGLAWTQAGGDILFIEVAKMPGKNKLTLTGHLGDVMKESCQAALSYIRPRWNMFKLSENFFERQEIHVHVPEGAVPKDGPSAGIAITTAMVSALTGIPVDRTVAMTGEITLRGRVMEIGGVKEKVIAAHRSGIKTVILPRDNKKDLTDIPQYVLDDLKFIFVEHMDEVLKKALVFPKSRADYGYAQKFLSTSIEKAIEN